MTLTWCCSLDQNYAGWREVCKTNRGRPPNAPTSCCSNLKRNITQLSLYVLIDGRHVHLFTIFTSSSSGDEVAMSVFEGHIGSASRSYDGGVWRAFREDLLVSDEGTYLDYTEPPYTRNRSAGLHGKIHAPSRTLSAETRRFLCWPALKEKSCWRLYNQVIIFSGSMIRRC